MSSPCTRLQSSPEAHRLCRILIHKKHIPVATLDRGVPYIKFSHITASNYAANPMPALVAGTNGNRRLEAEEIYTFALRLLEKENRGGQPRSRTSLSRYISTVKSFRPPWIMNDFNPRTNNDKAWTINVARKIQRIRRILTRKGLRPNTYQFNLNMARLLVNWVTTPRRLGGLGIKPVSISPLNVRQERTVLELLSSKNAYTHCTELCYILYPLFKMAGLNPTFILVYKDLYNVTSLSHVCIGIRLHPSKPRAITPIDLTARRSHWINTPHKSIVPISSQTMLGLYFNNRAVSLHKQHQHAQKVSRRISTRIKGLFMKGLGYNQRNPLLLYNLAYYYFSLENAPSRIKHYIQAALALYPRYPQVLRLRMLTTTRRTSN